MDKETTGKQTLQQKLKENKYLGSLSGKILRTFPKMDKSEIWKHI